MFEILDTLDVLAGEHGWVVTGNMPRYWECGVEKVCVQLTCTGRVSHGILWYNGIVVAETRGRDKRGTVAEWLQHLTLHA